MTNPTEETVADVLAEMYADGETPPSDPRDSSIQNILRPWRKAMKDRATRIEAAHAREIDAERVLTDAAWVFHAKDMTTATHRIVVDLPEQKP